MKRWIASIAAIAAILSLSACSEFQLRRHKVVGEPSPKEIVELVLTVEGEPIQELLSDPDKLREVLRKLDLKEFKTKRRGPLTKEELDELKKLLVRIKKVDTKADDVPKALRGIGGFSTAQLLEAIVFAHGAEQRIMSGKIRDYLFDENTMSGHLAVDTKTEIFNTAESYIKGVPDRVERYHWDIEVDGIYEVIDHSGNDLDPFPGTVKFTKYTKRDIKLRGLKYKLFAKGDKIRVRHIYQKIDDNAIERLPDGHPFYKPEPNTESCIDIMFDRHPPASELPPQIGYCLGRCAHPQVINSK